MEEEPSVVKEATCPSLSHLSILTYQVGKTPDSLRVISNSGNGYFSSEWVSLKAIHTVLEEDDFIWSALCPLFKGKSVNTACFLMAVLLAEGLGPTSKEKPRRYEMGETKLGDKPKKGGQKKPVEQNKDVER